jgi:CBS domain-containing protein
MRIAELMSTPALTVWSWRPIPEAGRLLLRQNVTALCVVDRDGRLVGVVSRSDLLRHRVTRDPRAHLQPTPLDRSDPPATVAEVMTRDVVALPPTADEADAAQLMLERRIRSIPVVDDGRLLGIVSVTDMLRAAVRGDQRIADDVRARLRESGVGTADVDLHVHDGVVTIGGRVSPEERQTVHLLAETVPGVVRVRYGEDRPDAAQPGSGAAAVTDDVPSTPPTNEPAGQPTDRPTDRRGLVVLDLQECLARLRETRVGRIAFVERGMPVVLPVNHGVDGTTVVFRTTWGSKLDAAQAADVAAFEIDGYDEASRTGWSVLVRGRLSPAYADADLDRYAALDVPAWAAPGPDAVWVVLRADEITGRRIVRPAAGNRSGSSELVMEE